MKLTRDILIGYLVIGVLFAIFAGGSINPFHLATWGNVLLWLPLMVIHFFWRLVILVISIIVVMFLLSMVFPQVRAYMVAHGQRLRS